MGLGGAYKVAGPAAYLGKIEAPKFSVTRKARGINSLVPRNKKLKSRRVIWRK